ncbi:HAD family hydrolase [Spirillospora sp. CA-142024]|uniref:HAD family hydrolase n=1 Tax=Spirillospora sp. CA-142024 TaxID=3240036 RepID=UPI003D8A62CB
MPHTRAVSFDGDDTLWDFGTALRAGLEAAVRCFHTEGLAQHDGTPVTAEWLSKLRAEVAARPERRDARIAEIRMESLQKAAEHTGARAGFAGEVFDQFMAVRHDSVRVYPETLACLTDLAQCGWRLALITNGNSDPSRLGLDALLEVQVYADDCGLRKPDPAIYRHAAKRLGTTPESCVHVGDHPEQDVTASHAAGMRPVWLNRGGLDRPAGTAPSLEIASLAELPPLLDAPVAG